MMSYPALLQDTLNISLAPPAIAIYALTISIKRCEKRQNFRLRLRRAEKMIDFLDVGGFASFLWKNFACPHACAVCKKI